MLCWAYGGSVHQAVKLEYHDPRKCFVMKNGEVVSDEEGKRQFLQNPRWRSSLTQAATDHLLQCVLYKRHSLRELAVSNK